MVGKLEIGASYSFYQGPFKNSVSSKDPRYWEEPISTDRIQEILKEFGFTSAVNLNWTAGSSHIKREQYVIYPLSVGIRNAWRSK